MRTPDLARWRRHAPSRPRSRLPRLLALVALVLPAAAPALETLASGLDRPFALLVDDVNAYWTEGMETTCTIAQRAKDGNGAATTRVTVPPCWVSQPDLGQDGAQIYFVRVLGTESVATGTTLARFPKAGSGPALVDDLYDFMADLEPIEAADVGGLPGLLDVRLGSVYSDSAGFNGSGVHEILRVPALGAATLEAVEVLASDSGQATSLVTDSTWVTWSVANGYLLRMPLAGGLVSTLEVRPGEPTSLQSPATGAGAGSLFWLEGDLETLEVRLLQRLPGGQVLTLLADTGYLPTLGIFFTPRGLAVDETHVYVTRNNPEAMAADEVALELVRLPIGGGPPERLTAADNPMALAIDASHLYWTDLGPAPGQGYVGRVAKQPFSLDVDGNGEADASSDGLLVLRYLFGLRGAALTADAVGGGASRDALAIESYLAQGLERLDIDGDGRAAALSDGLLVLRYLLGFRGAALLAGSVASGAAGAEIEAYLQALLP